MMTVAATRSMYEQGEHRLAASLQDLPKPGENFTISQPTQQNAYST